MYEFQNDLLPCLLFNMYKTSCEIKIYLELFFDVSSVSELKEPEVSSLVVFEFEASFKYDDWLEVDGWLLLKKAEHWTKENED